MEGFRKQMAAVTSHRDQLAKELKETRAELESQKALQSSPGRVVGQNNNEVNALREKLEESNLKLAVQLSKTSELEVKAADATRERDEAKKMVAAITQMEEDLQHQFSQSVSESRAKIEELERKLAQARTAGGTDAETAQPLNQQQPSSDNDKNTQLEEELAQLHEALATSRAALNSMKAGSAQLENNIRKELEDKHSGAIEAMRVECDEQISAGVSLLEQELKEMKDALAQAALENKQLEQEQAERAKVASDEATQALTKALKDSHAKELELFRKQWEEKAEHESEARVNAAIMVERAAAEEKVSADIAAAVAEALAVERESMVESARLQQAAAVENALAAERDAVAKAALTEQKAAVVAAADESNLLKGAVSAEAIKSLEDKMQHMKGVHDSAVQKLKEALRVAIETANAEQIQAQEKAEEIQRLQSQSKKLQLDLEVAVNNSEAREAEATVEAKAVMADNMALEIEKIHSAHKVELERVLADASTRAKQELDSACAVASEAEAETAKMKTALLETTQRADAAEALASSLSSSLSTAESDLSKAQATLAETVVSLDDANAKIKSLNEKVAAVESREAAAAVEQAESTEMKRAQEKAHAEAVQAASSKIEALQQELTEKEVTVEEERASRMRAERALREALEESEAEATRRKAEASDDIKRAVEAALAEAARESESRLESEREVWQAHSDRDRETALANTRKEMEARAKSELEKKLGFWRNTWSVEKDRAIEEALEGERKAAQQQVAGKITEAVQSARKEWDLEASRAQAAAVRKVERDAESALDGHMAKHAAEISAIKSALEVARELQTETKGLLEEREARVREVEEELVEAKRKRGIHGGQRKALVQGLHRSREQLRHMKGQLLALRKECGAFSTRRAPQLAELARACKSQAYLRI
eukprot:g3981.t1